MSELIYLLQAGDPDTGPIRIDHCQANRLRMRIGQLQAGNPDLLLIRALYQGDENTLAELRHRYNRHRIHDAWHTTAILDDPPNLEPVDFDREAERRKIAIRALQTLSLKPRA